MFIYPQQVRKQQSKLVLGVRVTTLHKSRGALSPLSAVVHSSAGPAMVAALLMGVEKMEGTRKETNIN